MNAFFVSFFALLTIIRGVPLEYQRVETNPELTAGYFEGDMVLEANKRNGLVDPVRRWPNNTVYYKINEDFFDDEHRDYILRAMRIIEEVSCIHFEDVTGTDKPYYVNITGYPSGCYSTVGYTSKVQNYNLATHPLDKGCFRVGTIVHEFLHTLGFLHMQSAWNRDEYVYIAKENIDPGMIFNFYKFGEDVVENYDQEYDYGSIMHYPADAFSINGKMTIIPLKEKEAAGVMGQRRMLPKSDVKRLNIMYKCPKKI